MTLKQLRQFNRLNQEQAAQKVGINVITWRKQEDHNMEGNALTISMICKAFGVIFTYYPDGSISYDYPNAE